MVKGVDTETTRRMERFSQGGADFDGPDPGRFDVEITDLNHAGEGVGRKGGRVVFVPNAAPGDIALVRLAEVKRSFARAELLSLSRESPDRVVPPCPVHLQCGGCQLQHISYEAQLAYKTRRVKQAIERIGGLGHVGVRDCIAAPKASHYRNKAVFSYCATPSGSIESGPESWQASWKRGFVSGFYGHRTHDVVDLNECIIQNPLNNLVFETLNRLVADERVPVFAGAAERIPRPQGVGALLRLLVRCSGHGEQALAVLIGSGGPIPGMDAIARSLMTRVQELAGVSEKTGGLLVDEAGPGAGARRDTPAVSRLVAGQDSLCERILGLQFIASAESFFQVNPEGMEVLYQEVLRAADPSGDEVAVDAYCGIGSISLTLARECRHVFGIEAAASAVEDARRNAALNAISNSTFIPGRVEDVLDAKGHTALARGRRRMGGRREGAAAPGVPTGPGPTIPRTADLIVLDPPRAGCDRRALDCLARLRARRIVYVSCNPETLARDLARLETSGYRTACIWPIDMFPQTAHVECIAAMYLEEER